MRACTKAAGEGQDVWHQLRTSSSWAVTLTSFDRMNPPPGIGALNSRPNFVRSNVVVRSRPRRVAAVGIVAGPEISPFSSIGSVMPLTVSSPLAVTSSPETSIEVAVKRISG